MVGLEECPGAFGSSLDREPEVAGHEDAIADGGKCSRVFEIAVQIDDEPRVVTEHGVRFEPPTQ